MITKDELPACAAYEIWMNGARLIVAGKRHCDCLSAMSLAGIPREVMRRDGFMTTRGRFVGRKEALSLMERAGIKSARESGYQHAHGLFSEDLY